MKQPFIPFGDHTQRFLHNIANAEHDFGQAQYSLSVLMELNPTLVKDLDAINESFDKAWSRQGFIPEHRFDEFITESQDIPYKHRQQAKRHIVDVFEYCMFTLEEFDDNIQELGESVIDTVSAWLKDIAKANDDLNRVMDKYVIEN